MKCTGRVFVECLFKSFGVSIFFPKGLIFVVVFSRKLFLTLPAQAIQAKLAYLLPPAGAKVSKSYSLFSSFLYLLALPGPWECLKVFPVLRAPF